MEFGRVAHWLVGRCRCSGSKIAGLNRGDFEGVDAILFSACRHLLGEWPELLDLVGLHVGDW